MLNKSEFLHLVREQCYAWRDHSALKNNRTISADEASELLFVGFFLIISRD